MVFGVGQERLALPTALFGEITEYRRAHPIPHRRGGMLLGLVSVRGTLLLCIDLAKLLGAAPRPDAGRHGHRRLAVIRHDGMRIAVPVDEVYGVLKCRPGDLRAPPETVVRNDASHTKMVLRSPDGSIGLLDVESLFDAIRTGVA